MSSRPRRNEYTHWNNEQPITDLHEALHLLGMSSSSSDPHHLARRHELLGEIWELVASWYREGDSGGDSSGFDYFQIDQNLARELVNERLVQSHVVKYRGGSYEERDKFVISAVARERLHKLDTTLLVQAETLLRPGVHTDLTGKPNRTASGRDRWRYGRFFVDYVIPNGECCRVYPSEGALIVPYPSKSATL